MTASRFRHVLGRAAVHVRQAAMADAPVVEFLDRALDGAVDGPGDPAEIEAALGRIMWP